MFGFLIAVAAGFLVPHLEAPIVKPLIGATSKFIKIEEIETRLVAFMVALFGAGIVSSIFDSGSFIGLSIGMVIGYFGTRILNVAQKRGG